MNIGDYVRTKNSYIHKITDLKPFYENDRLIKEKQEVYIDNKSSGWNYEQFEEFIIKSSPNIKDLIQVGDIITVEYITGLGMIRNENVKVDNTLLDILQHGEKNEEYHIISVLTKEQFERNEYKI